MATPARNIHRHTTTTGAKFASEKLSSNTSSKVPVKFVAETLPHEEYKDFYPLNVSKVAEQKSVSPILVIISIIFVLGVAVGAGWYVVQQQESESNNATVVPVTSMPRLTGTVYQNKDYGFSLSLPVSWASVVANEISIEQTNTTPLVSVSFILPDADGASTKLTLMEIEVYTAENWQSLNELTPSDQAVSLPRRIGVAGNKIVTVKNEAQLVNGLSTVAEKAITDIPTVTTSFAASL